MSTLLGMRVVTMDLPPVANIQIDPGFKWISPDARARINAWLRERFGTHEVMYLFNWEGLELSPTGVLMMNPKRVAMLRSTTSASSPQSPQE